MSGVKKGTVAVVQVDECPIAAVGVTSDQIQVAVTVDVTDSSVFGGPESAKGLIAVCEVAVSVIDPDFVSRSVEGFKSVEIAIVVEVAKFNSVRGAVADGLARILEAAVAVVEPDLVWSVPNSGHDIEVTVAIEISNRRLSTTRSGARIGKDPVAVVQHDPCAGDIEVAVTVDICEYQIPESTSDVLP